MKRARSAFDLFVFSNIFIALCAVAMAVQTAQLLPGVETFFPYLWFVFFASICSYNFHWWLTYDSAIASPRIDWARRNRWLHFILFFAGLAGAAVYFFLYLLPWWWGIALTALSTFLYSAPKIPHPVFRMLRKVAYGKTIFLSFIWMNVTTLLPIWISGAGWEQVHWLFIISRYLMIYAICILFDYRDREDDRARGVKSMVTFFSERNVFVLFLVSVVLYAVATLWLGRYGIDWTIVGVLLLPGVIGMAVYQYATRNFEDYFFYFVLDGVMALPAFLTLLGR
jgi:4-hydroxybenzoate polyprenyltransferase